MDSERARTIVKAGSLVISGDPYAESRMYENYRYPTPVIKGITISSERGVLPENKKPR